MVVCLVHDTEPLIITNFMVVIQDNWTEVKIGKECVLRRVRPGARYRMM